MRFNIISCALLLSAASAVVASPLSYVRSAQGGIACPLICDVEGCVPCHQPEPIAPCPDICTVDGCVPCDAKSKKRSVIEERVVHPCPDICTQDGCVPCDAESKKRSVIEERVVHPCPEICNEEGECGCEYEPPQPVV